MLDEKAALTLLGSALGGESIGGRRERLISYSVSGLRACVMEPSCYGAFISTSNRPLADEVPGIAAILSRIPSVCFSPTDRELRAALRDAPQARAGSWPPHECVEVVEHAVEMAGVLVSRLALRWLGHGYYLTHAAGGGAVDWRDLTKFRTMKMLTYLDHAEGASARDDEIVIAWDVAEKESLAQAERLCLWEACTDQSATT